MHFLLAHLHETLKKGLTQRKVGRFGGSTAASAASASAASHSTSGHDLASMELARLSPAALLQRLLPALLTLRRHTKVLLEGVPTVLDSPAWVVDADAAWGAAEDERAVGRFVEPALLLVMQTVRRLLETTQLADEASQAALFRVLSSFDDDPSSHAAMRQHRSLSQAAGADDALEEALGEGGADDEGAPPPPAYGCCAAFDFFADLLPNLPSIALQAEVVSLCKAALEKLAKHAKGVDAAELAERRERLAALASSCLSRATPDDRDLADWVTKPPPAALVKGLFETQGAFTTSPTELLRTWTQVREASP